MTLEELEAAYRALNKRLVQLEKLVANCVSVKQLNEVSLLLENQANQATSDLALLKSRVTTLENTVSGIS